MQLNSAHLPAGAVGTGDLQVLGICHAALWPCAVLHTWEPAVQRRVQALGATVHTSKVETNSGGLLSQVGTTTFTWTPLTPEPGTTPSPEGVPGPEAPLWRWQYPGPCQLAAGKPPSPGSEVRAQNNPGGEWAVGAPWPGAGIRVVTGSRAHTHPHHFGGSGGTDRRH